MSHEFSDQLWNLHTIIGYVLCGLLLSRIIIEIAQPREEKLSVKFKTAMGFKPENPSDEAEKKHYIQVKGTYLVFYILILTMALTGLGLAFQNNALLKPWRGGIRQIHIFVQYLIYAFILVHLMGLIRADGNRYKGLVSRMIHGKKQL